LLKEFVYDSCFGDASDGHYHVHHLHHLAIAEHFNRLPVQHLWVFYALRPAEFLYLNKKDDSKCDPKQNQKEVVQDKYQT